MKASSPPRLIADSLQISAIIATEVARVQPFVQQALRLTKKTDEHVYQCGSDGYTSPDPSKTYTSTQVR
jgi:hypothetical protein